MLKRGRKPKLTPELQQAITLCIYNGAFAVTAAKAAGIGQSTFYLWLHRGTEESTGVYHDFALAVMQARANARAGAEQRVYQQNPLAWLRRGPGRDKPDSPGWSDKLLKSTAAQPAAIPITWGNGE